MKKQTGFTLIELVVTMIIIGLLSSFAVPRLITITTEAKETALAGFEHSLRRGIDNARSQWLLDGHKQDKVLIGGVTVKFTNGYPVLTVENIRAMLETDFGLYQNDNQAGKEVLATLDDDVVKSLCYLRITQNAKTGEISYHQITNNC